jgi:hypothetical protein
MQSTMMSPARQIGCASKPFSSIAYAAIIGVAGFAMTASPASALVNGVGHSPGYCGHYIDPSGTQGFWNVCP